MSDERPSKKQREILEYIDTFIREHGFGPSYREMMRALGLKSVSTVATHVDGLIAKGYLVKREHSARSLQVVTMGSEAAPVADRSGHLAWLRYEIAMREADGAPSKEVEVIKAALELLDQTDKE